MNEEINADSVEGIHRRDLLRKGAMVGAMVWAAPLISSAPAFAQGLPTPTPGTTTPTPTPDCGPWSYLALVLTCTDIDDSTQVHTYQVKYDRGSGWDSSPGNTPQCEPPDGWGTTKKHGGNDLGLVVMDEHTPCWKLFVPNVFDNMQCVPSSGTGKTGAPNSPQYECGDFSFTTNEGVAHTINGVTGKVYEFCRKCADEG